MWRWVRCGVCMGGRNVEVSAVWCVHGRAQCGGGCGAGMFGPVALGQKSPRAGRTVPGSATLQQNRCERRWKDGVATTAERQREGRTEQYGLGPEAVHHRLGLPHRHLLVSIQPQ